MRATFARALMVLAARALGDGRREWALAMEAELECNVHDRSCIAFAAGCLWAALRQMPAQERGRFVIANYALALGLLIPTAGLQLACVAGYPAPFGGHALYAFALPGRAQQLYMADAYPSAVAALLVLWLLLALGQLRLAWALLERDWSRVAALGALAVAISITLVIFTVALFLDPTSACTEVALLAAELAATYASARWDARLSAAGRGSFA